MDFFVFGVGGFGHILDGFFERLDFFLVLFGGLGGFELLLIDIFVSF